jgi:uncharacterized delta-60 repeat protein
MRRLLLCLALLACAAALGAPTAAAAPADLDRAFGGGDGIAEVMGPKGSLPREAGARMAIGPHDEIFVLYSDYPPCDPPFDCRVELTVVRYTPEGNPDPTFASEPQLILERSSAFNHEFELAVGPDGKPVVVAYGDGRFVLARFGLDGRLDPSFGVGGIVPFTGDHAVEGAHDFPKLAAQPDGKIVVAVQGSLEGSLRSMIVARFLANGEYDPAFGSGGETVALVETETRPIGVFVGADGSITVPAPQCCLGSSGEQLEGEGIGVVRLNGNGQPDPAWGGDGSLFIPTYGGVGKVEAAASVGDGGVLLSIERSTPTVSYVGELLKLTPGGLADPSFGNGGGLRLFNRVGAISLSDLTFDAKSRLVGVGYDGRIAVFRLRPDGGKDRTFNGGERIVVPYGGGGTTEYMVGIQSSGRIVAFGDSGEGATKRFGLIGLRGGADRSRCLGKKATIVGTAGRDELTGTPHRDVIAALAGADKVRGLGGPDLICGGKGRDVLFGGPGKDTVQQDPRRRR